MATYTIPTTSFEYEPSNYELKPLLPGSEDFLAANEDVFHNIRGGSRYQLFLTWRGNRAGVVRHDLEFLIEAASLPGDDLRVFWRSNLGYKTPSPGCTLVTTATGNVGSRQLTVNVTGAPLVRGSLLSYGGRLYRAMNNLAVGNGQTLNINFPLRGTIPTGSTLVLDNPSARFETVGDTPEFLVEGTIQTGLPDAGDQHGPLQATLRELQ